MHCSDDLDVRRLRLRPGDVVVVRVLQPVTAQMMERIGLGVRAALKRLGLENRYIVLDYGLDVAVLTREEIDSRAV